VVTVFPELFRPFAKYRLMFFGLALLLMMIFKPAGILPRLRDSGDRLRKTLEGKKTRKSHPESGSAQTSAGLPESAQANGKPLLRLEDLDLSFGGVTAVSGMELEVTKGGITALIGPNGAGKTTVFNIITGIYKPMNGRVLLRGEDISSKLPHQIAKAGVARTFQNIRIFPSLTCLENVLCGQHSRGRAGLAASMLRVPGQRDEESRMLEKAQACLARVCLSDSADSLAAALPYGKRRYLEIARALAAEPELIVLDDTFLGVERRRERRNSTGLLKSLVEEGLSVFLIEHDMNLVDMVSDHVVVMQSGKKIAEGPMCEMRRNPKVIEAYLGSEED
jgi:ABC-type branched-subunit amino acid transport system ATPase component